MKYDVFYLENEYAKLGVNPDGGYLTSWQAKLGGSWVNVLYEGTSINRGGIPILFPYFGKANSWPQHGFSRNCVWEIIERSGVRLVMQLRSDLLGEELRQWYPYTFIANIIIELGKTGELLYSLEIVNLDEHGMPICPGLHPYWSVKHENKSFITLENIKGFNASEIDWSQSPPDNCYDFSRSAVLHLPGKKILIDDLSAIPTIKHLVVWSLTPLRDPDYDFVCVEPIVGYNYAIDRDPVLVGPGSDWSMTVRFSLQT